MAVTVRQYLDGPLRWRMFERGMQVEWNRLNQLLSSICGSGITASSTEFEDLDTVADGTGFILNTDSPLSGPFRPTGTNVPVTGEKVVPPDPGGNYGPTPVRLSQKAPTAGFRLLS